MTHYASPLVRPIVGSPLWSVNHSYYTHTYTQIALSHKFKTQKPYALAWSLLRFLQTSWNSWKKERNRIKCHHVSELFIIAKSLYHGYSSWLDDAIGAMHSNVTSLSHTGERASDILSVRWRDYLTTYCCSWGQSIGILIMQLVSTRAWDVQKAIGHCFSFIMH